jgi:hypothetical protein
MKRTALKRKTPLARGSAKLKRKRLNAVSAKRRAYRASEEGQRALAYMQAVKRLPCVVCAAPPPSEAHHCINGRYGSRKASDFDVIPLCAPCHRTGPLAIHNGSKAWAERNGPDTGYIEATRAAVRAMEG